MENEAETAIAKVLVHYFPGWEVPENKKEWNPCLCPSHDEDRPSCSVNFDVGAVKCMACGFAGNVVSIIQRKEGMRYAEAVRYAEEVLVGCDLNVSKKSSGKRSRAVFGESRADGRQRSQRGPNVRSRVRGRTSPWS